MAKHTLYFQVLKGNSPTDLVELGFFRKKDDVRSGTAAYQTVEGMPWELHFPTEFSSLRELKGVQTAYPYVEEWASSYGSNRTD